MASTRRLERLQKQILRSIAQKVLFEAKDPRLMAMVTLTKVKLTKDVSSAKIYYSVLGDEAQRRLVASSLDHMRGHLRTFLGGELRVRSIPEIEFVFDESIEKSIRFNETLRQVEEELAADALRHGETEDESEEGEEEPEEGEEENPEPLK